VRIVAASFNTTVAQMTYGRDYFRSAGWNETEPRTVGDVRGQFVCGWSQQGDAARRAG